MEVDVSFTACQLSSFVLEHLSQMVRKKSEKSLMFHLTRLESLEGLSTFITEKNEGWEAVC